MHKRNQFSYSRIWCSCNLAGIKIKVWFALHLCFKVTTVWDKCGVGSQELSVSSVSLSDLAQLPFRSDFICGTCLLTPAETQLSAETEKG